eukprot:654045-Pleurochrysis_carterae.AAC.3
MHGIWQEKKLTQQQAKHVKRRVYAGLHESKTRKKNDGQTLSGIGMARRETKAFKRSQHCNLKEDR